MVTAPIQGTMAVYHSWNALSNTASQVGDRLRKEDNIRYEILNSK
jgi:hypothetical protein